jgi:Na+/melibiose symporter-like transporter
MVRVSNVVTVSMQPFFLIDVLKYEKSQKFPTPIQIAIVPLISYVSSLVFSLFFQQKLTRCLRNRFLPMMLSIVIISLSTAPLFFLTTANRDLVYLLSGLQGIGQAIMTNTGTSLISDVIGNESKTSAFVYGSYSLMEKFVNGGILFWMISQYTENDSENAHSGNNELPLRLIMSLTPMVCSVTAFVCTFLGNKFFSDKLSKITGIK